MTRTKYHNAWLKKHPKARNKARKANYKRSRPAVRKKVLWSEQEIMLLAKTPPFYYMTKSGEVTIFTDKLISIHLGRSVQAIQQKRYQLKKEERDA